METPIERVAALTIGTVESVSPSEIKVLLETDAPQATALNTGAPAGFPRINGYLLIPNETGTLVGMIVWLGVERSDSPKRTGMKDFGLIDLPFPLRKVTLTPLGTLIQKKDEDFNYKLERGVAAFPSVGDPVLLPTAKQLKSIIEAADPADRRVAIGTSPLASDAQVTVDPDKIFGRHLAVLGNTGSGKSCTVAGIIRWSLEAAGESLKPPAESSGGQSLEVRPNARFIVLDPNGEYSKAFGDMSGSARSRVLSLSSRDAQALRLVAPHWAWSAEEWTGILRTGPGFQAPVLRMALQNIKNWSGQRPQVEGYHVIRFLSTWLVWLEWLIGKGGPRRYAEFPGNKNVTLVIDSAVKWLSSHYQADEAPEGLGDVSELIGVMKEVRQGSIRSSNEREYQDPYDVNELERLKEKLIETLGVFREAIPHVEGSADRPKPFSILDLGSTVEMMADRVGDSASHAQTMLLRLRRFEEDADICSAIDSKGDETLADILRRTFGAALDETHGAEVVVLNLSFVPRDVLQIVISVLARMIFESLQWFREVHENNKVLPTVLVLEEAHTFVQRQTDWAADSLSPSNMCRCTFERIAREGRKYGLGLVLSSQRPSEISPTVLAQCNTFILHRIVNDQDQQLVSRLVPDNLAGFLQDLPNLPTRRAVLLGWATPVPVLVEVNHLEEAHRPQSEDPDFWKVWTREEERDVDWERIARRWQGEDDD